MVEKGGVDDVVLLVLLLSAVHMQLDHVEVKLQVSRTQLVTCPKIQLQIELKLK